MINHSISNKMISLNSLHDLSAQNNALEASRRKRTPSKYAESIRELTKMASKNSKKEKNSESNEEDNTPTNGNKSDKSNVLTCILPKSNRKFKLSIIIKKNPKPKLKKAVSSVSVQKDNQKEKEKQKPKNVSLLDTLLQVVEQYKADEQNKKGQVFSRANQVGSGELETGRKETKPRKQKEQEEKYIRFYEKYRSLNEKYDLMQNQMVLI